MPASKISIDNAKKDKLFYVVASAVVYRPTDGRCLILKRDSREKVHPGKYGVCGGKLEWKDLDITRPTRISGQVISFDDPVEDLLKREIKEEAGIEVHDRFFYISSLAFVRPDDTPVVLLRFAAEYKSGEVKVEKGSFTDSAWVNGDEVDKYDCIDTVPKELRQAIARFS
jgi:8-oxo-dGTP pyrophosphatase MutT (NUDIX family)